ncbi:MAG: stage V sporulation protein D, partial [Merdibacter sp.]
AAAIEALEMEGVYLVTDARRYYPKGSYLGQVLGFTGIDNQGLAGLELQYDEVLQAQRGSLKIPFDAKGQNVTLYEETYEASGNGLNVVLTIDSHIQDIVEREMRNLMERYEPKQALAIAMDPDTGEILPWSPTRL